MSWLIVGAIIVAVALGITVWVALYTTRPVDTDRSGEGPIDW